MASGRDVLETACSQLGVTEQPPHSNRVKYNAWYYGQDVAGAAYPWCMAFVQWCYDRAGAALPFKTASCGALLRWYRANRPACIVSAPRPGDIVIFDFPGGGVTDHAGIFESAAEGFVTSIDGNTGGTDDANGGAVLRRRRGANTVAAYIHPEELREGDAARRYHTLAEIVRDAPWAEETTRRLLAAGAIRGTTGSGPDADLDLSGDMLRLLVINDRMAHYDE